MVVAKNYQPKFFFQEDGVDILFHILPTKYNETLEIIYKTKQNKRNVLQGEEKEEDPLGTSEPED